jgi:hypothetical protein
MQAAISGPRRSGSAPHCSFKSAVKSHFISEISERQMIGNYQSADNMTALLLYVCVVINMPQTHRTQNIPFLCLCGTVEIRMLPELSAIILTVQVTVTQKNSIATFKKFFCNFIIFLFSTFYFIYILPVSNFSFDQLISDHSLPSPHRKPWPSGWDF